MQTIETCLDNGILTVTLNRPEQLNAFNEVMLQELIDVYKSTNDDEAVRVIIVTGAGKAFCAGMDLAPGDDVFTTKDEMASFRDLGGQLSLVVYSLQKPIIAALNGAAVGIGITMTLPMDVRIVKTNAKVGFVFGRRGIGPEAASGWFLTKHVGISKALEWLYTGRMIPTDELIVSGLMQYAVDDPYVKAVEIAKEIIGNTSPVSNAFSRQLLWQMHNIQHPLESHLIESRFLHWVSPTADVKEGIQSFKEKRLPNFTLKTNDIPNFFGGNELTITKQ